METLLGPGVFNIALPSEAGWTFWELPKDAECARAWLFPIADPPLPGTDPRVLSAPPPARRKMLQNAKPLHEVVDEGERLRIRGTVESPSVLVLSDAHYPDWKAILTQDGETQPVEIEKAFGRWRAVYLAKPGQFELTFIYDPESFRLGRRISIWSLLIWSVWFSVAVFWSKLNRPSDLKK